MALSLKDIGLDKKPKKLVHISELGIIPPWKDILQELPPSPPLSQNPDKLTGSNQAAEALANHEQTVSNSQENWEQTGNKPETKREQDENTQQTLNKHLTQSITNTEPLLNAKYNNYLTNTDRSHGSQEEHLTNTQQTLNKRLTQHLTTEQSNTEPLLNKDLTKTKRKPEIDLAANPEKFNFLKVTGLKRGILFFLFKAAQSNKSRTTPPISVAVMASHLKTTKNAVEVILSRMNLDDGSVVILDSKKGRDGWVIYKLPDVVYEALWNFQESGESKDKLNNNLTETERQLNKYPTQSLTQSLTSPSSSSSLNKDLLKTTTTEPREEFNLDEAWLAVDTSYLDEFGFSGRNLISQVARTGKLTPQQVQDSIKHFAFDLKKNNKGATIKGDRVAYFLAILKRGEIYNAPSNYEDPTDEKLRIYINSLKEQTQKREKLKEALQHATFEAWQSGLTEEEKQRIAPCRKPNDTIERGKQTYTLLTHFNETEWPTLQEKVWGQVNAQMGTQNLFKANVDVLGQGREG